MLNFKFPNPNVKRAICKSKGKKVSL